MPRDPLADFVRVPFSHGGTTRDVYRKGFGPAVVVVPEIPGITPTVAGFGRRLVREGYTVWIASLYGTPGQPRSTLRMAGTVLRACISRDFHVLALHEPSPIVDWLRALGRHAHALCGGPGIGAVGMCLTGQFALAMALDDALLVPVLSQPSTPFSVLPGASAAVQMSDAQLAQVRDRCIARDLTVLGMRFTGDVLSPPQRFDTLRRALGDRFEAIEIPSGWGEDHGKAAHSVLTEDLVDVPGEPTHEALQRVLALLRRHLAPPALPGPTAS